MIVARFNTLLSMLALSMPLLGAMTAAQAKLVQWNLKDVAFADGGTAAGFFVADPEAKRVVDYDLKVSGGSSGIPAFEYTPSNRCFGPGGSLNFDGQIVAGHCGSFYFSVRILGLDPASMLAQELIQSEGGTVALMGSESYPTRCCRQMVRGVLVGAPVPIPEPSTTLLLLAALTSLLTSPLRRLWRRAVIAT